MELLLELFMAAAGVCAAVALVWGWLASPEPATIPILQHAELVPIAEYPDGGMKRIVGELSLLDEALIAPLSGRECAVYEVRIDCVGAGGRMTRVAREVRGVSFVIRDQTGRAIVHPEQASVALTLDKDFCSDNPSPGQEALLRRIAKDAFEYTIRPVLGYSEGVLEPGDLVAVLGHGKVSLDETADGRSEHDGGYREPAGQTKVTIVGSSEAPVFISDDPSVVLDAKRFASPSDVRR